MKPLSTTLFLGTALFLLPLVTHAQLGVLVGEIGRIVEMLIPILVGVAVLVFIWGLIRFIAGAGNETKRAEGKKVMIWGIIAIFVMVSLWGIIAFLQDSFLPQGGIFIPF